MKLGLGSAQFGQDYGVTNAAGRTSTYEIKRIIEAAARYGIEVIDTAPAYGDAERTLGAAVPANSAFRFVSKTPTLVENPVHVHMRQTVDVTLRRSLRYLRRPHLYGLLVHRVEDLLAPRGEELYEALLALQERRLVQKIGVSLYCAREVDAVMARFPIELVQVPVSLFDQRLVASGHLRQLKQAGVEVHARSLFLQGVLLAPTTALPPHLRGFRPHLERLDLWTLREGIDRAQAVLGFAKSVNAIDVAVIGVTNAAELAEVCRWYTNAVARCDWPSFAVNDEDLIDPRRWPLRAGVSGK